MFCQQRRTTPETMNTAKRTLVSAAIFAAAISAFAQGPVTFKGSVIPLANDHGRASIRLSVDGVQQDIRVKNNGHFRFTVQHGQQVRMISSCEGFVQKEVVIDAAGDESLGRKSVTRMRKYQALKIDPVGSSLQPQRTCLPRAHLKIILRAANVSFRPLLRCKSLT